ncbi:putative uroporphyrin-III C/tetrapyrrole methyltransferase [Candidatus Termititenax persephonae]|uniref:Ribosomal RNA small subunit methyltransferase I n=1 Tax=Candidatus Termititenax persephonae TaxID=2218525 RepID=A0A388TJ22_9BACT|nr:putative uroporphyrin-III C/tetrapyrrole methyltransferase [Candidatus Termititenax persephonae]
MPLVLCGMPLGNPGDITPRVLDNLRCAEVIAAEDTRSAALFLQTHGLKKKLLSFYDHNERERVPQILELLRAGKTVAVMSEAGMPLISDPGYHLVKAAQEANVPVTVVPGPTALTAALALSGLPTDRFIFEGFLPAKAAARQEALRDLRGAARTLIFYEAPHRIQETLRDMAAILPGRLCFVARELTKKYQEYFRGTAQAIAAQLEKPKGEFVIVLAGRPGAAPEDAEVSRAQELCAALKKARLSDKQSAEIVAKVFQLSRNQAKKIIYS